MTVYPRTVRSFGISLDALQAAIAIAPEHSQGVEEYVEQSRAISEQARINLDKHIDEHGCQDQIQCSLRAFRPDDETARHCTQSTNREKLKKFPCGPCLPMARLPAVTLLLRVPCPEIFNPVMADGHFVGAGKRNAPIYKLSFVQ